MASLKLETAAGRRFDSLEQEVFLNLWRTYDSLHALEEELFERHDLTPQQYNALRLLRSEDPQKLPTLALASRLVSHAPDITRMLDKLERRGYVRRDRPAANRRTVLVGITVEGKALLKELQAQVRLCHQKQLGHLSDPDLRKLAALLRRARQPHERDSNWV